MVRVDMSVARAQIQKRHRRRRLAAARRLARARQIQEEELAAAEAARLARLKAIEVWTAEEERLEKLRKERHEAGGADNQNSDDDPNRRTVRFAGEVLVTEIPIRAGAVLPEPVASPIGVAITDAAIEKEKEAELGDTTKALLNAVRASGGEVLAMDEDWSDDDDETKDPTVSLDDEEATVEAGDIAPLHLKARVTKRGSPAPIVRRVRSRKSTSPVRTATESVNALPNGPSSGKVQHQASPAMQNGSSKSEASSGASRSEKEGNAQTMASSGLARAQKKAVKSEQINKPEKLGTGAAETTSGLISADANEKSKKRSLKRQKPDRDSSSDTVVKSSSEPKAGFLPYHSNAGAANGELSKVNLAQQTSPPESRKKKKRKLANGSASPTVGSPRLGKRTSPLQAAPTTESANRISLSESPSANGSAVAGNKNVRDGDADEEEIDNLFEDLAKKRAAQKASQQSKAKKPNQAGTPSKDGKNGKVAKVANRPQRYTEDGLRIVSYEDIAADQPANLNGPCPFECSCCFV